MLIYKTRALVIGSGCAGLNAADTLFDLGETDVVLATEGMNMGTSRNTGSDKQTYYKLSLTHDCADGVGMMAESYAAGGAMDGALALAESANSLPCFFKLCRLGVPFPKNEFGEYVGYKTDHDDTKRATSVGPLTSKYMTEALEKSVTGKNIRILDNTTVFKLFVSENTICGALGYDRKAEAYVLIETSHIVLATGGSAALYKESVYPISQTGMSGMAYAAGAKSVNLTEWQYGLASVDFRWNVSGTYQQVLPRYISIDADGKEHEFLSEALSAGEVLLYTFQKGYQWPFDCRKRNASSKIDMLVHAEILKGRKVYMDFMHNPKAFRIDRLPDEAYTYLNRSNALRETPVQRLRAMNEKAYQLYLSQGIDLEKEFLRVAVCAQHQNGGVLVDENYQSTVTGLYVCGEAAGVFGVYRPGGSALNSTQVSSMRAAEHIAKSNRTNACNLADAAQKTIDEIQIGEERNGDFAGVQAYLQQKMSDYAAFSRNLNEIIGMEQEVHTLLNQKMRIEKSQITDCLKYRDFLLTMREVLCAMHLWCEKIGARGGAAAVGCITINEDGERIITEGGRAYTKPPAPIPNSEVWFETVYNRKEEKE